MKTGKGYDTLNSDMKDRLAALYAILDHENACYHFNIGARSSTTQQDLYDRWHKIADGHKDDKNLCKQLHAAHFAQCPTGWRKDGTARGGPAKPGTSRHELGEAADITVTFPPDYVADTARFHAAAQQAGLCGPPSNDPVHVELPYKTPGETTASCHFG